MKSPRPAGIASAAMAAALFALAGHVGLLVAYGTVLPYRDQWQCTADDLLGPWSDGQLGLANFFQPLNDHWPVLTRLLSFGLVRLNGQWNNLVETSVNALLLATAVGLFLRLVLPGLQSWTRAAFAVLAGAVFALPITWENTLWGIQSLVYLQILLTLVYLGVVCFERERFSVRWWFGHAAGLAVLFTQHSAILAHVAAAILFGWRLTRREGERRLAVVGLAYALVVIGAFVAFFPSITTTAALRADSWQLALEVALRQLAWPLPHPGWAFVVYLPWIIWTIHALSARKLGRVDGFILVLGLWVGGQAAAIGYGRATDTFTFASRYCDFLALGWLLNAACVGRLWLAYPKIGVRVALVLFLTGWLMAPVKSFWFETTESHAGYNLLLREGQNHRNLERLRTWFATHNDQSLLSDPGTQQELFTYAPTILRLVAKPQFQSVLPPETGSPLARQDHGRLRWLPALLLPSGWWLVSAGFVLLGVSLLRSWPGRSSGQAEPIEPAGLSVRGAAIGCSAVLAGSLLALLAWPHPFQFDRTARLHNAYTPTGKDVSFAELEFQRYDGDVHNVVSTRGAVDTEPANTRIFWYGTRLATKPDFHGVLHSRPFSVTRRYLVVPFTGYPCFPGNGLRVLFVDPKTQRETWVSYVGPDARLDWNFWTVDAAEHRGEEASIFLFDGLDGATGWLGVGRPAQTNEETFSTRWRAQLRAERAEPTHRALAGLTLGMLPVTAAFIFTALIGRRKEPRVS
jgi:hypothetical protein